MKKVASYSVLLLVVILGVLPLWGKDAYLVFPFEDKTEQNLSEEARSAFNIALFATGRGDVIPYHLRSPMVKRLIADGSLTEEEVTSVPSDDRAMEIGKLLGANYVFLGSVEELKEEEGTISVMERARMLSVAEGKQVKEAVVTGKSRGKVNGVSREAAVKEALDDAARSLVSALVGAPAPSTKPAEIRRKERSNYYLLGAILLGWVVWNQTREKAGVSPASGLTAYAGAEGIVVSWRSGSNVDHYVLKKATVVGGGTSGAAAWNVQKIDPSTLAYASLVADNIPGSQTSYLDYDISVGSAYAYKLESIGRGGELISSLISNLVIPGAPPSPSNVGAKRIANYVEISWALPAGAVVVKSYKVYRGASQDGPFQLIGSTDELVYMDTNPPTGNVYYRVASVSSEGAEGIASDPVLATSEETPPQPYK